MSMNLKAVEKIEGLWRKHVEEKVKAGRNVTEPVMINVSFEEFKEINAGKSGFTNLVNNIAEVRKEDTGNAIEYMIKFNCGSKVVFDTTGNIQKYKSNGDKSSTTSRDGGHVVLKERDYANSDLTLERLVYTAECILADKLPESFDGLQVNCMDLCGNTQNKIGIDYNMDMQNLELVSVDENRTHGRLAYSIYSITGKMWRFTARDFFLSYVVNNKPQYIEWYMNLCGYPQVI